MSATFSHTDVTGRDPLLVPSPRSASPQLSHGSIDWRSVRRAGRACCCTAKPAVVAVMPATADRPHTTELLLCWHHYRASRKSLAAAGATVMDLAGEPVEGPCWQPAC